MDTRLGMHDSFLKVRTRLEPYCHRAIDLGAGYRRVDCDNEVWNPLVFIAMALRWADAADGFRNKETWRLERAPKASGENRMSIIEDVFKGGNIMSGLAVGIGIAIVAPIVIPVLRPMAKSVIKAGLVAYDQGRVAFAEMAEKTEDMLAEARSEMDEEARASEAEAKSLT